MKLHAVFYSCMCICGSMCDSCLKVCLLNADLECINASFLLSFSHFPASLEWSTPYLLLCFVTVCVMLAPFGGLL